MIRMKTVSSQEKDARIYNSGLAWRSAGKYTAMLRESFQEMSVSNTSLKAFLFFVFFFFKA